MLFLFPAHVIVKSFYPTFSIFFYYIYLDSNDLIHIMKQAVVKGTLTLFLLYEFQDMRTSFDI